MPARYFLRTREQYENAPVGTKVACPDLDVRYAKTNGKWLASWAVTPSFAQIHGHRHEVIRWGDR